MPNDEIRKKSEIRNPNLTGPVRSPAFGIRHSDFIRHSSFVIRISSALNQAE